MYFIIPIGDENPTGRKPYVNYILIGINILVFVLLFFRHDYQSIVREYGFIPARAAPTTYITSLFLHGSVMHLLSNMLFLYIVGDNVEDKLGHFWYLLFYLICGAAADFAHARMIPESMMNIPTIGASGAISAVLGAYLCLFPRNNIIFFWFFWILVFFRKGIFKVRSFWAIGFWFALQFFSHITSSSMSNVAYGAHIGGFMGGAIIIAFLVMTGVVKAHWDKARDYSDVAQEGMDSHPYEQIEHQEEPYQSSRFVKPYQPPRHPYSPGENISNRDDDYW